MNVDGPVASLVQQIASSIGDAPPADRRLPQGHKPAIVWLTGLSGAGKSTLADAAAARLESLGRRVAILDGDDLRAGLNRDLGFSGADRDESVRRAAEVARLMAGAGLIVIVALISPYRRARLQARSIAGTIPFLEVFVDTPHLVCEHRDPKGLYAKARDGRVENFTSVSDPYEVPDSPDMAIKTWGFTVEQAVSPLVARVAGLTRP